MKTFWLALSVAAGAALITGPFPDIAYAQKDEKKDRKEKEKEKAMYPTALLTFEERGAGAKDLGPKVVDLLFAKLAVKPDLYLVDRADLKKVLDEQSLSLSGAVKADEAVKVGQLTGAKLILTGSIVHVDKKLYLVVKIIGTETGRVVGASAEGAVSDDLGQLVGNLADSVEEMIGKQADKLMPKPEPVVDRIAAINKKLGKAPRPTVAVSIAEKHIGAPAIDPAAETEMTKYAKDLVFDVIDLEQGGKGKADVFISGEGFSEVAGKVGNLISVRARLEVKAVDRKTGKVLAVDRQTVVALDVSEQIASKTGLQNASAILAERMLPKLIVPAKKK